MCCLVGVGDLKMFLPYLKNIYTEQRAMKLFSAPVDWLQVEFLALLIAHKVGWKLLLKC